MNNIDNITVNNISKSYKIIDKEKNTFLSLFNRKHKLIKAVSNVSFSVQEGEVLGLVGLNGAGKTSIIKMASGVMKPDNGSISIFNEDPFHRSSRYKSNVSLVFGQNNQLHRDLSIHDNVIFYASLYGISKNIAIKRLNELASDLLLTDEDCNKQVRTLSYGQRTKGEILLSFIHFPKIIFLDEPTLGLDVLAQQAVRAFLSRYVAEKKASILLTSHYLKDIEELCQRILVIKDGKTIFYDSISLLKRIIPNQYSIKFLASDNAYANVSFLFDNIKKIDEEHYMIHSDPNTFGNVIKFLVEEPGVDSIELQSYDLDFIIKELYRETTDV